MVLRRFGIDSSNEEKAKLFELHNLGKIIDKQYIRCKICASEIFLEECAVRDKFWKCQSNHNNKYNEKFILVKKYFEFDFNNIIAVLKKKLDSNNILDKTYFLIYNNSKNVPIFFFDMPLNTSVFNECIMKKGACFVYVNDIEKAKFETPYNQENFISLYDFLAMDNRSLLSRLDSISNSCYPLETLGIYEKIRRFIGKRNFEEFEKEIVRLFNDLKIHEDRITTLLDFLSSNRKNPTGNKFVHIGSNDPLDMYPIELFSYISGLLKTSADKGYDAKMFSEILTYQKYKEKKESNTGKQLIFISSAPEVESKIWRDIKKARENNSGEWFYFVLELDLLSLILYYVGSKDYFN